MFYSMEPKIVTGNRSLESQETEIVQSQPVCTLDLPDDLRPIVRSNLNCTFTIPPNSAPQLLLGKQNSKGASKNEKTKVSKSHELFRRTIFQVPVVQRLASIEDTGVQILRRVEADPEPVVVDNIELSDDDEESSDAEPSQLTEIGPDKKRRKLSGEPLNSEWKNVICTKCRQPFQTKEELISHKNALHDFDKQFECHICRKRFGQRGHLKEHVLQVHMKIRRFKCDLCPRAFGHRGSYKKHVFLSHGIEIMTKDQSEESQFLFTCLFCEKAYRDFEDMAAHQRTHDNSKDERTSANFPLNGHATSMNNYAVCLDGSFHKYHKNDRADEKL